MILGAIVAGVVGIALIVIGCLIWKKEMISLLHDYHYDKVADEDKKAFCTLSGIGVLAVGISVLVTGAILVLTESALSFVAMIPGNVIGLVLLIYAGHKYNK